ncbi:amidohydrolase family protein [Sneathiella litorea]|uniref:Amidohydrolase family protein n=1 Tax=Sneathiella litorea TaxID=2606216 RepID=A0A6L8WA07_9PROT|nr:amidohydrolase family protein [Sneathiella litorea]MZR31569.1 amidohydrolase family protein [Sneathiella litorea]
MEKKQIHEKALGDIDHLEQDPLLYPSQPIIDAHHHLYDRKELRYLLPDFQKDLKTGHNIRATVFVQARSMYRETGPEHLRSVGETEFAVTVADQCACDTEIKTSVCDAIVGYADLQLGKRVAEVLEAHIDSGKGRFRGIRHIVAWDADKSLLNPAYPTSRDMMDSAKFRAGFSELARAGLSFDAWLFFHQLNDLVKLARAFPETSIIVNHCGGILGIGKYTNRHPEVFAQWKKAIVELSGCDNVSMKIGGFGLELTGFSRQQDGNASSQELARGWKPWVETCIEAFGTSRCMFESNFPADRAWISYDKVWNTMKWLTAGASVDEKDDLFWRSASRLYRLQNVIQTGI